MYSAFWLWAIAQALLLPNWVAGFAGLVGFGTLYFGRVAREERMMLQTFGDSYREYMARTGRVFPWILRSRSRPILICGTTKSIWSRTPQFSCHSRNIWQKTAVGTANSSVYSLPSRRAFG